MIVKMWIILFYPVMTMFVSVKCSLKVCGKDVEKEHAWCRVEDLNYTLDFIPPVSSFILYIDLTRQPLKHLPENAFKNLSSQRNISKITLNYCQIKFIHAEAFLNLCNLAYLYLQYNEIDDIDIRTFQYIPQIKVININNNKVKILKTGLFKNLTHLEKVELAFNEIHQIEKDTFKNTPSLEYITFQNNLLQHLDISFKDTLRSVTQLYLHRNPWNCNCDLLKLYDFFFSLATNMTNHMPNCKYPLEMSGQNWKEVDLSNPQIIKPPYTDLRKTEGSTITLSCLICGNSTPDIKWMNSSTAITPYLLSNNSYRNNNYVNFTFTAQKYNAGKYVCSVNTSNGEKQTQVTLYVQDAAFPWIYIFIALVFIIGIITGSILKFISKKFKLKHKIQIPPILKRLSWWRGRARQGQRSDLVSVTCRLQQSESSDEDLVNNAAYALSTSDRLCIREADS